MEPQQHQQQQQHTLAATSQASQTTTTPQHATATASATGTATAAAAAAAANTTITITTTTTVPALASTATAISATTNAATAFSGSSVAHQNIQQTQHHLPSHVQQQQHNSSSTSSSLLGGLSGTSSNAAGAAQQTIEKLSRPAAFDKMESLVREMQDPENGVPVRQQKMFLTSIPYAFMGYDLIEWLMDRLLIEESEALNIANQLCLHGYFFPVNDTKTLVVKDDSSLYRFQTPYYWPWQHKAPDNVEYAIYLAKRSLRNKQRHALEDYEVEALASLHKNLKGKWDFISMQAEEQVRLAKERKKGDKIVGDSQERAYWRVHRPPPGQFTPLEPCPVPSRDRQGAKPNKKKTVEDAQREVDYLRKTINRTRMKMSQACESLVNYSETFVEYDFFLQPALPSNPWVTEDTTFWQLNNTYVDIPTEKRVKRWAISIDELVSDPTGLQEFTNFLEKEYSHENIRFWIEVNRLRRSAHSQVTPKVNEIFEEFLKPGAPCEINIDGKTMESVLKGLVNPSRFTFDSASDHIYMLLLKKDCYPRFVRSEHYKRLLESGIQPSHKKRFFNFGGVSGAKKKMTAALSSGPNMGDVASAKTSGGIVSTMMQAPPPGSLARRRGSDRSLTGSAHELAVIGVNKDATNKVPHSHSQSNLSEMPYSESVYRGDLPTRMVAMDTGVYAAFGPRDKRLQTIQDAPKPKATATRLETTIESTSSAVCPWDLPDEPTNTKTVLSSKQLAPIAAASQVQLSICPWEQDSGETSPALMNTKSASQRLTSTSSDISEVSDRLQRSTLGIRHQNTVDSGEAGMKRLMPNFTEQRRASVSFTPGRISDYQVGRPSMSKTASTPSPTVGSQIAIDTAFPPLYTPLAHSSCSISKDVIASEEPEVAEIFKKLSLTDGSDLPQQRSPSLSTPECTSTALEPQQATSGGDSTEEEIQDVQIELIETSTFIDPDRSSSQRQSLECVSLSAQEVLSRATTPTINVEECGALVQSSSNSNTPSPNSPKLVVVVEDSNILEILSDIPPTSVEPPPTREPSHAIPPPLPLIGPMEEEQLLDDDGSVAQEELSPTTDEYQEGLQFGADSKDVYDYDIVDTDSKSGYIAPAPTPAPSMAPLAEIDMDTVEDETLEEELCKSPIPSESEPGPETIVPPVVTIALPVASAEEVKKRRKKRNSESKRMTSLEEKEKEKAAAAAATEDGGNRTDAERNTVCPWEDENVSPSDGTFVKTYATLGYL